MSNLILPAHVANDVRRDRFFNQSPQEVAEGAMSIITHVQDWQPEQQMTSVGLAFVSMCNAMKFDPREVLDLLFRMNAEMKRLAEARAVEQYAVEEIRNAEQPTEIEKQVKAEIDTITKSAGGEL